MLLLIRADGEDPGLGLHNGVVQQVAGRPRTQRKQLTVNNQLKHVETQYLQTGWEVINYTSNAAVVCKASEA